MVSTLKEKDKKQITPRNARMQNLLKVSKRKILIYQLRKARKKKPTAVKDTLFNLICFPSGVFY